MDLNNKYIIIDKSIKEGSENENCSLCKKWGSDVETQCGVRKGHSRTRKNGIVLKECNKFHHLAVPTCVCSFFEIKTT